MNKILRLIIIWLIVMLPLAYSKAGEASIISESCYISKKQALPDGTSIAIHYSPKDVTPYQDDVEEYINRVLAYAIEAYKEIVYVQGFDSPGFTFANPDKDYCYDSDRTIDIFIVSESDKRGYRNPPCYDIIKGKGAAYEATIAIPADYKGYILKWAPTAYKAEDIDIKLKATIYHEMLHLIIYSYNKNVEPWYDENNRCDWYMEGLARYAETFAGSYHNFFAEGFIREENGKKIVYKAGANYLMQHPEQPLQDARYDYALFWAYIHKRYGMQKIEELSRRLRYITEKNMKEELPNIISKSLNEDFNDVVSGFAIAVYFKHFNPDIKNGLNDLKIMSLTDFSGIRDKKISSWASNFITLNLDDANIPGHIAIKKEDSGRMKMNVFVRFENGKIGQLYKVTLDRPDILCQMDLAQMKANGVKELILILTNIDAEYNIGYSIK